MNARQVTIVIKELNTTALHLHRFNLHSAELDINAHKGLSKKLIAPPAITNQMPAKRHAYNVKLDSIAPQL